MMASKELLHTAFNLRDSVVEITPLCYHLAGRTPLGPAVVAGVECHIESSQVHFRKDFRSLA